MFIVGIDIAKRTHKAVIIDSSGRIIQKSFRFENSIHGYNKLMEMVKKFTNVRSQISFGMESTSHYWLALYTRLMKDGYAVHVINPIQSDALRGLFIRQNKSNEKDCLIIAEVIRIGRFSETKVPQEKMQALREMCRNRYYIVDSASDLKRKITALVDQVFPEYEKVFSNIFVNCSIALLMKYPTPEKIFRANTEALGRLIYNASNGYHGKGKAVEIKELAKKTFGLQDTCGAYSSMIVMYLKQLKFIQAQVEELDKMIMEIFDSLDSKITTVSGVGNILGAVIVSEIGDISRFKSADKLAAFAGVDPTVKKSGDFVGVKNHMSKRGTPYLRRALWQASVIAIQHDPMFKAFFDKKSSEGKRYMTIVGHCTKKMISVIFAVLRDNKDYMPMLSSS